MAMCCTVVLVLPTPGTGQSIGATGAADTADKFTDGIRFPACDIGDTLLADSMRDTYSIFLF